MNRRGFLKRAAGAVGALALGSSIIPKEVKAKEITHVDVSPLNGEEGGYIVPSDIAEALSLEMDKAALRGDRYIQPRLHSSGKVTIRSFNSL